MSTPTRIAQLLGGTLLGLVLVEGGLQALGLAVASRDALRTGHALRSRDGDLRVLCLGACYTIGIGTPPEAAYPAQLERLLDEGGHDTVVVNGGQRGKSIDYFSGEIETLLDEHQPDILVVGVNRRTSLQPSDPLELPLVSHLILPKLVQLAVSPPPPPSPVTIDPIAREIHKLETFLERNPDRLKAWSDLSTLQARRGDYAAAIEALGPVLERRVPRPPPLSLRLFRYTIALGDMDAADTHIAAVRADPAFVDQMKVDIGQRVEQYEEDDRNVALRTALDRARHAAVSGDYTLARSALDQVIQLDPDTADAWHLLAWLDHTEGRPPRSSADAFLGESHAAGSTDAEAFRTALSAHLDRILVAADQQGTTVVLHTLAAAPEQLPIIHEVADARRVLVVDVQTALARVDDPTPLFHPTDHLRFSEAGNRWLAAQIHAGLKQAGLTPAD